MKLKKTLYNTWYKVWLGLGFDTVESRAYLSFSRTIRFSSNRHDLILPPLARRLKRHYIHDN